MIITIKQEAELFKTAVGNNTKRLAYLAGKSESWIKKLFSGEYPNFWFWAKFWLEKLARIDWASAEMFFNDFELFRRELWRELKGQNLPFPNERERELVEIYQKLGLVLVR